MNFNLDLFRALANQNQSQEMINQANAIISNNIGNPNLAIFVLSTYSTPEVQNDQTLIQIMAIVFYRIVDHIWKLYPDKIQQYSPEVYSQVRNQIILIYSNTPDRLQQFIIDALKTIIIYERFNSEDLVGNICTLINPQQNLHTISFVFQILEEYSNIVSINKDQINRGEPFCQKFLQIWSVVFPQIQASFSTQPTADSFQILKSAGAIMRYLTRNAEASFKRPEAVNLIQFFMNALIMQNNQSDCIKMKESLLLFFRESLKIVQKRDRKEYVEWIQKAFLSNFNQFVPQIFATVSNNEVIDALGSLINIFYVLIKQKFSLEWFFSPTFLYQILVPAARLTPNDLNEFESSPGQYLDSCLGCVDINPNINETSNDLIPRTECAKIIQIMFPLASQLLVAKLDQFSNPLDLEAYLYLIYQAYANREESVTINGQLYLQIFGLLNSPNLPIFLYPTILCALQNNILLTNYDILKSVSSSSYQIVMNPQINLISIVCALSLFRMTITSLAEHNELESLVNIRELIPKLIQISSQISTDEVQYVMQNLIRCCPSKMMEFSHVLFGTFAQSLEQICKLSAQEINVRQEDELDGITNTFYLLFSSQVNMNDQLLFAQQIISFSVNILQMYINSSGVIPLIKLCIKVFQKANLVNSSNEMKVIIVKFVQFALAYLSSSEDAFYLLPDIGEVFTTVMQFIDPETLQNIQVFCVKIIQQPSMEELVSASALLILSDIILIHGINVNEIFQLAINLMRSLTEFSTVFIGCIFVLTSALFKTNGEIAKHIPEDILVRWLQSSSLEYLQNAREIHIYNLGLLILASQGNAQAFKAAGDLLYQDWQRLSFEDEDIDENANFEEDIMEYDGFDDGGIPENIILPVDSENASKLFLQLASKSGLPNNYPDTFLKWLHKKAEDK